MVRVGMGLKAVAYPGQWAAVYLSGRHDIGTQVDQQIIIDQHSGTLPQARTTQSARLYAVLASTERLRICVCGRSSQESNDHRDTTSNSIALAPQKLPCSTSLALHGAIMPQSRLAVNQAPQFLGPSTSWALLQSHQLGIHH